MSDFPSWRSYQEFAKRVRSTSRYFRDELSDAFCETVLTTCTERRKRIDAGSVFHRSQKGEYGGPVSAGDPDTGDQPFPHLPRRMIPLRDRAVEGRTNPKGIPYLYLATDRTTAIAESRAGVGEYVSVGAFRTERDLLVVDCSIHRGGTHFYFEEPSPEKRTAVVWSAIDQAFSQPVSRSDDTADYVPTQILAELFKMNGFDGIVFKSSLADGKNIVLFDLGSAKQIGARLYQVSRIAVEFDEASNPYSVTDQGLEWNTVELVGLVSPSEDQSPPTTTAK